MTKKKPVITKPAAAKAALTKPEVPRVPRAGPPTNVRPGGPHADTAEKKRTAAIRQALKRIDIDDEAL